ncbi:hypothetical protein PFLUV_G00022680 [Perca fluviatilis]|uniref:Galaxin-like repeats domain-containing protein n=1 Tax=Perca fluviatilis TaxID=8168 RepID=A0A6A5FHT7_PERFL|nr:hypothetical protein PFLUV_G00022680 [Perca fluviatilis]
MADRQSATGATVASKNRKTCLKIENDIREAVCHENHLPGAGWSCCGGQAFHPEEATCCKDGYTKDTAVTEGLSEKVSACCGLKAYDQLNFMCCNSTIIAKPAPNAKCCDNDAYDVDKQMCCGPIKNKTVLTRNSSYHRCCGRDQFDSKTERCCSMNESLKIQPITSSFCRNESAVCGTKTYNTFTELCCQSTVVSKLASNAKCCAENAYDVDKQMCCGPMENKTVLTRNSSDHRCCGSDQFDSKTERCCFMNDSLKIQPITSGCCVKESAVCGTNAYNTFTELCCQSTVVSKPASNAKCCAENAYDVDKQMCCGPMENKTILMRNSSDHRCCGRDQFDSKTECCCFINDSLKIQPITSSCCGNESGVQQQKPTPQPNCTEPNTGLCGSACYNPSSFRCCEKNQGKSQCRFPGQCDDASTVYNPHTHVCWDGFVSEWKSWIEQFHVSPGQHCCGTEVYQPRTEICCDGHRHAKKENTHCCGGKAYNIKDPQMKCCAGTLHNLTLLRRSGHDVQCCGSILQTPHNVCCSSEDKEVLYSAKRGFGCCGHLYYNVSLWSCCAGKLSPVPKVGQHQSVMIKESRLLSVNNLNETDLCDEMQIGTVESVSQDSIMFSNVLKIHGRNATVKPLASPHILETPDRCSSPKLIPGNSYFFDEVKVFTDFNHNSILQSLYFILSKCYRP